MNYFTKQCVLNRSPHKRLNLIQFAMLFAIFLFSAGSAVSQQTWDYSYTGAVQTITLQPGNYQLEVWGAQGGSGYLTGSPISVAGGNGGYSVGEISVTTPQTFYVYVGGQGTSSTGGYNGSGTSNPGGFNGGGTGYSGAGGGGGATHIATASGELSSLSGNQSAVLIVAGAGGGGVWTNCSESVDTEGAPGGGLTAPAASGNACGSTPGGPGTQVSGGSPNGAFGLGGDYGNTNDAAGGGAGWYGGGGSSGSNEVGGGGSSYIAAVLNGSTTAGNASMPNPSGGTMVGNTGIMALLELLNCILLVFQKP